MGVSQPVSGSFATKADLAVLERKLQAQSEIAKAKAQILKVEAHLKLLHLTNEKGLGKGSKARQVILGVAIKGLATQLKLINSRISSIEKKAVYGPQGDLAGRLNHATSSNKKMMDKEGDKTTLDAPKAVASSIRTTLTKHKSAKNAAGGKSIQLTQAEAEYLNSIERKKN